MTTNDRNQNEVLDIDLGEVHVRIDDENRTVTSLWRDMTELVAKPVYDDESIARAKALGYEIKPCSAKAHMDDRECDEYAVWLMTSDHDLLHHVVAQALGKPFSRHLRRIAIDAYNQLDDEFGKELRIAGDEEERMVMLLAKALNCGREGILPR